MTVLTILEYPDPRLRTIARPVTAVTEEIRRFLDDMLETMYLAPGIGLAATQVNVHQRILVMDVSETKDQPVCLINPVLIDQQGSAPSEEGCLSVPGVTESVDRAEQVQVRALDRNGDEIVLQADGLLAVCVQHEIDHLDGKLFVDYLSEIKRQRIKKKAAKTRKRAADPAKNRSHVF